MAKLNVCKITSIYPAWFEWQFLDFGIVYRIDGYLEQYNLICLADKETLIDLYKFWPSPQAYLNAHNMDGAQFEDAS